MEFLRTSCTPAAVVVSYLATIKLTRAIVGEQPYEANTFWKVLAHLLPVRNSNVLPSPTPWVYSREYLGCLGRNMTLCLLPTSSNTPEQLVIVTEDILPETATTFTLWQVASFLATKFPNVVDAEWATYAILDTVAQDLASGSRGRLSLMASSAWNGLEEDLQAFLEGEDVYADAIEDTAAPLAAAFGTTTNGDDDWEDDTMGEEVPSQIHDISMMLQRIAIKHRRELEHVMRISSDQANKLVRSNKKLRQVAIDAEDDARDVINHNHNKLLDAQEKVTEVEAAQKTLIEERKAREDAASSLQADHSKLTTDYKALTNSYESAIKSAGDAGKDLVNVKDTVQILEAEVKRLKADMGSAEDAQKDLANDVAKELSEANKKIGELCDVIKKTEADNAESEQILEDRIDELQAELSRADVDAHDKALALNEEISALKDEVCTWQETSTVPTAEIEALEKAKSIALEDKTHLTAENDKLKDQVKELQANYNGDKYNKLDKERGGLQRKLADQKQATLVAQGNARRLEGEVAALQKQLQVQAGSNDDEVAGNIGSKSPPPTDSPPSRSTFNEPTARDPAAYHSSVSKERSATTTVPELDPFTGDAKAAAARKEHRAAIEARFTNFGFFPGATAKTENEVVSETMVDELEKLPSKSLSQSMWAPKGPQNAQQPIRPPATGPAGGFAGRGYGLQQQGQPARGSLAPPEAPKKPAAMLKKNKKGHLDLPPHLRGSGPGTPPAGG